MVEHLLSMCKVLDSISSTTIKKLIIKFMQHHSPTKSSYRKLTIIFVDKLGNSISREKNLLQSLPVSIPEKSSRSVTSSYYPVVPCLFDYADGTLSTLTLLPKTHTGITKHCLGGWSQIIDESPCFFGQYR